MNSCSRWVLPLWMFHFLQGQQATLWELEIRMIKLPRALLIMIGLHRLVQPMDQGMQSGFQFQANGLHLEEYLLELKIFRSNNRESKTQ